MENIEKLYTPSEWCSYRCDPKFVVKKHIETITQESQKIEEEFQFVKNVRYGDKPRQLLDLFEPLNVSYDTPTFIYIHGGYWQELNKDISKYCVKPLLQANIRVIIPGYDLAPDVTIDTIMQEVEELGKYVHKLATERQWKNIWYGGHSAGAHLAASLLCSEIFSQLKIDGFVLISGIYDLKPLTYHNSINKKLNITRENCKSLSPLFKLISTECRKPKILIIVGEYDSPAFHQQSILFMKEMEKLKFDVTMYTISDTDHFTVVENLKNGDFTLTKLVIENIRQFVAEEAK